MSKTLTEAPFDLTALVENLVTEDDEPVDNLFSEKQQRLLAEPLYSSWTPPPSEEEDPERPRPFLAATNVGIFPTVHQPPLVPDVFVSLDVSVPADWHAKSGRSYFFWEFGKAPEVVVEIVSNRKGGELSSKLRDYARMAVPYYIVYDPTRQLSDDVLWVYERRGAKYESRNDLRLPDVGLSLVLWSGVFEEKEETWLRWCDADGTLLLTGRERAARAEESAALAKEHADRAEENAARAEEQAARAEEHAARAEERATQAEERAMRLAVKLRELGLDPEQF